MARPFLPINDGGKIESDVPGVPAADPKKQIPIYPSRVVVPGMQLWNFAGLNDPDLYPSPHQTGWGEGWVPRETRRAMLRHHKVYQGINNLKNAVVGDGGRWIPAVNPYRPGEREQFDEAVKYTRFMEFNSRMMNGSNWEVARQLLDCIHEGNKIAPITLREQQTGKLKGSWVLDRLQVWPNDVYAFHQDEYGNFTEVHVGAANVGDRVRYPKEKFLILSYRPINNNPYGTQVLVPVYDPFYKDIQTDYEEMAYMATFGRPSVIVFAAPPPEENMQEEAQPLVWADGTPVMEDDPDNPGSLRQRYGYQVEQNKILFTEFKSGSVWSMNYGALVQVVEARPGGADLFRNARADNARAIMGAIYGTHQVTEAERNVSTGNQEVGEGVAGLNVTEGKRMLEEAEENSIAKMVLTLNFGPGAVDLLPIRDYGSGQNGRLPKMMNAQVGFASNGAMDKAQYWDYCAGNGLPLPWPDAAPLVLATTGTGGGDKTGANPNPASSKPSSGEPQANG